MKLERELMKLNTMHNFHENRELLHVSIFGGQAYRSEKYCVLLYKDAGPWIGIRIKGGKQVFSFGRGSGKSEKELRALADRVLKRLDDGESEDAAKAWARGQVS